MKYKKVITGNFVSRPNRFLAEVLIDKGIDEKPEIVHVKNTGRLKELLTSGAKVYLSDSGNPARKTRYDLVAVWKDGLGIVNIDSQAANAVVKEWLMKQDFTYVRPEYAYGESRIDFYMEKEHEQYLMEVKGCTLEIDGIGYFPDAPTERGVKHLKELTRAAAEGYHARLAFVIQMDGIREVRPNTVTHPAFAEAMTEAKEAGVEILYYLCKMSEDEIVICEECRA